MDALEVFATTDGPLPINGRMGARQSGLHV